MSGVRPCTDNSGNWTINQEEREEVDLKVGNGDLYWICRCFENCNTDDTRDEGLEELTQREALFRKRIPLRGVASRLAAEADFGLALHLIGAGSFLRSHVLPLSQVSLLRDPFIPTLWRSRCYLLRVGLTEVGLSPYRVLSCSHDTRTAVPSSDLIGEVLLVGQLPNETFCFFLSVSSKFGPRLTTEE